MSTNEIKSTRYAGLIEQATKLHTEVETKGWKLAEVFYEAVEELKSEGFVLYDQKDRSRMTAIRRVAADVGVSQSTVERYWKTWRKFPDPAKRDQALTFNDHMRVTQAPSKAKAIKKRRAELNRGTLLRPSRPAVPPLEPYNRLSSARSSLRKIIDSNIWDYPDREKALAYAQEIQQLAQEVLVKFGGQKDANPVKVAA